MQFSLSFLWLKRSLKKLGRIFSPNVGLHIFGGNVCMCMHVYLVYKHTKTERESLIKIRFLDVVQPCGVGKMIGLW